MSLKIFQNALIASTIIMLAGCSADDPVVNPATEGKVELSFETEVPMLTDVTSRASYGDTDIANCDAIVFDENGKLIEVVRTGAAIVTEDGKRRINVLLEKTTKKRTIHLVANARYPGTSTYRVDMTHLREKVTTEGEAMKQMKTFPITASRSYESQTSPVIMWGRIELANGIQENMTYPGSPKLLRAEACVRVTKDIATEANRLNDFEILGVAAYENMDCGFVTLETHNVAPSVTPTAARPTGTKMTGLADNAWIEGENPVIYVYERNNSGSDYATFIIHARYEGNEGYYKVVLMQNANVPYNLIRNHRYNLKVLSVYGPGYHDLATCLAGRPTNALNVQILDQDLDYPNVASDANYRLSINCTRFEMYRRANAESNYRASNIEIATVYSNHPGNPQIIQDDASTQWLRYLALTQTASGRWSLTGEFVASDNQKRTARLGVRLDNLVVYIDVIWHPSGTAISDDDSYVVEFPREGESNWAVYLTGPIPLNLTQTVLSSTYALPSNFTPGTALSGGVSEIRSRFISKAYYHIIKQQGFVSKAKYTATDAAGDPICANLVFYQG